MSDRLLYGEETIGLLDRGRWVAVEFKSAATRTLHRNSFRKLSMRFNQSCDSLFR